ncbi:MAG: Xaa-Pro peptidase family protein [Candidatus Omnitrophota bacterium]
MTSRLKRLLIVLEQYRLDALLVSHQPNIAYLCGFPSSDSYLLITRNKNFFITDSRYYRQACAFFEPAASPHKRSLLSGNKGNKRFYVRLSDKATSQTIAQLTIEEKIKNLGFEAGNLNVAQYLTIKKTVKPARVVPTRGLIEEIRIIKDSGELLKIKRSVRISVNALKYARKIIHPGLKEIEIAAELERFIRYQGARTTAFMIIVASGKNSAFAHHITSDYRLKKNESLFIDIGVDYQGYKSDLTRPFFLGKIPSKIRKIHDIIRQAQALAIKKIKPGVKICEIDKSARQYIDKRGYGGFFSHSLGHGIGMEIHEQPHISGNNIAKIKSGMVFTVEPAIYLPDNFGIRVEDDVVVTKNGCEVLSANID